MLPKINDTSSKYKALNPAYDEDLLEEKEHSKDFLEKQKKKREKREELSKRIKGKNRQVIHKISNLDDFFFEEGVDGAYRGSLNDFIIIFLCRNFISYYRGSWNSIEGVLLDEVTAEFMYDSISSIKTFEDSNVVVRQRDDKRIQSDKMVFEEVLMFSTADGEFTSFAINDDVKRYSKSSSDNDISSARESAELMRKEVRQRRVDGRIIKNQFN